MRICLVLGAPWLGSWGDILEVVVSWDVIDEEVRVMLNLIAMGMYYPVFPNIILVHFNSAQFNLTHSAAQLILQIFIEW